jgi:hypothetical protein
MAATLHRRARRSTPAAGEATPPRRGVNFVNFRESPAARPLPPRPR